MLELASPLIVLVALVGWGAAASRALHHFTGIDAGGFADRLALGIAVVLTIAGIAVAMDAASSSVLLGIIGTGVVLAAADLTAVAVRVRRWRVSHVVLWFSGGVTVVLVLLFTMWRTAHFPWNTCDDDTAYLYLARRLLVRGDLFDPLNNRRLTSLGGMSALHALFLVRLPDAFLPLVDMFLGSVLMLAALWQTARRRWSWWGLTAGLVVIIAPTILGGGNTSPTFLPAALTVVVLMHVLRLRTEAGDVRAQAGHAVVIGMLTGTLTTLRPQFGAPVAVLAAVFALWPPLGRVLAVRAGAMLGAALAVVSGWAVASWRAVATPLFPLLSGNLDPKWPSEGVRTSPPTIGGIVRRTFHAPNAWLCGMAALIGVGVLLANLYGRREGVGYYRAGLQLAVVAHVIAFGWVAALVIEWWDVGAVSTWTRFSGPVFFPAVVVPLVVMTAAPAPPDRLVRLSSAVALALVVLVALPPPVGTARGLREFASETVRGNVLRTLRADRYRTDRPLYTAVASLVGPRAKVIAAVDEPHLLLHTGSTFHTIDIPGSTSPSPHMPSLAGYGPKLAWLRDRGYQYVVAVRPDSSACLYNRGLWQKNISHGGLYGSWAPYALDWDDFVDGLTNDKNLHAVSDGKLVVVQL